MLPSTPENLSSLSHSLATARYAVHTPRTGASVAQYNAGIAAPGSGGNLARGWRDADTLDHPMLLRPWLSQRMLFVYGALLCAGLMLTALYMQHVMRLEPCPLCIFQRLFITAVGVAMLAGAVHDPRGFGRQIYGALVLLFAVLGGIVAGRHVWLQHLPADQVPECGPGLSYMLDAFPLGETLSMVFRGSGECAEVQWTFITLSIPEWTLIVFVGLGIFGAWLLATRRVPSRSD